jgi:hypothetical protein
MNIEVLDTAGSVAQELLKSLLTKPGRRWPRAAILLWQ